MHCHPSTRPSTYLLHICPRSFFFTQARKVSLLTIYQQVTFRNRLYFCFFFSSADHFDRLFVRQPRRNFRNSFNTFFFSSGGSFWHRPQPRRVKMWPRKKGKHLEDGSNFSSLLLVILVLTLVFSQGICNDGHRLQGLERHKHHHHHQHHHHHRYEAFFQLQTDAKRPYAHRTVLKV